MVNSWVSVMPLSVMYQVSVMSHGYLDMALSRETSDFTPCAHAQSNILHIKYAAKTDDSLVNKKILARNVRSTLRQCFLKVFQRVSWWSFRVSTLFSLLCLILDFHKNASFPENMLNYLNTTFTVGKQTKDNLINRKFQYRPTYSFTHFCAHFLLRESRGQQP